ncbi:MAG TPA: pirin family protein [Methanoregulaceae archaeon]|nr:pirin family protein [Methanoregulaceae archaeon]
MTTCTIRKLLAATPTLEGAGVHLKRVFGFHQVPELDPFLLLDDFHSGNPADYLPGFPWHPHRGIETITYVLHGKVEHGDSMGNRGVIGEGDIQWMTAGNGIIHQEMPGGDADGLLWGFQLWANLPGSHKMMDPRYREVKVEDIPVVRTGDRTKVRVIAGEIDGVEGPVRDIVIEPEYLDISVLPDSSFVHPVKEGHTVLAYVIEGKAWFDEKRDPFSYDTGGGRYFEFGREALVGPGHLVIYGDGNEIRVDAGSEGVRFLLCTGKPLREPVAWSGPIVMNTRDELRVAFEELKNGNFIKYGMR